MIPPEWFEKGSLPPWVFQVTGLALLVFVVLRQVERETAILLPAILSIAGIAAFNRWAGKPRGDGDGEKEA